MKVINSSNFCSTHSAFAYFPSFSLNSFYTFLLKAQIFKTGREAYSEISIRTFQNTAHPRVLFPARLLLFAHFTNRFQPFFGHSCSSSCIPLCALRFSILTMLYFVFSCMTIIVFISTVRIVCNVFID